MALFYFLVVLLADITAIYSIKESIYIISVQEDTTLVPCLILSIIAGVYFTIVLIIGIEEYLR
ncbi:hypothetical protein HMPREF2742_17150 [Enterococcus sp. HMSC072H05]|nr:hypothetical protein HMPREF2742_17150 [Enterococcus sp. HMSC072H05]